MHEIAGLIREFPFGAFLIITGIIAGVVKVSVSFINRNKPECDCEHDCECDCDEDDDDDEGEGPAVMGGQEED